MTRVTLTSLVAGLCSLAAVALFVETASAGGGAIDKLIVGKWEMVKGPEGDPPWDIEFTREGAVLVYVEQLTLSGKYKILNENTIETQIRSLVDPKKVTTMNLRVKVSQSELTITDGNLESTYRRAKAPAVNAPNAKMPDGITPAGKTQSGKAAAAVKVDEKLREHVKRQVEDLQQSLIRGDYGRVADLTFAKIIEEMGGRDKVIAETKAAMQEAKDKGIGIKVESVELPTDFAQAGNTLYAVVPYKMEVTGPGVKFYQSAFVVGVSGDQGKTWTFVDGGAPDGLRRFLPDLPPQLQLPLVITAQ